MSVSLHRVGAFLRISLVVFNFRLTITLRRLGTPYPSSLVFEQEQSKAASGGVDDPQPLTNSPPTAVVPPPEPTWP